MLSQSQINKNLFRYFGASLFVTTFSACASIVSSAVSHEDEMQTKDFAIYSGIALGTIAAQIGLFAWSKRQINKEVERYNQMFIPLP